MYHFDQFGTSHVTGPSVVLKFGPCHRSWRPVSKRNVWQCWKVKNQLKKQDILQYLPLILHILALATTDRAQNSRNCQFWHCLVSRFSLGNSHQPFVSKCQTDPMCHSHRSVSNWMKRYNKIKVKYQCSTAFCCMFHDAVCYPSCSPPKVLPFSNSLLMLWLVNSGAELLLRWGGMCLEWVEFCLSQKWLILMGIVNKFPVEQSEIYLVNDNHVAS